jgi:DNA polymerase I-like protein with 3'-5' exonuclease and polymerase domains
LRQTSLVKVPTELVEETRRALVAAMEITPPGFSVPLKVEVKAGRTRAERK